MPLRPLSPTGIVSALPEELEALLPRLASRSQKTLGGRPVYSGTLAGAEVVVTYTGAGFRNAEQGVRCLLEAQPLRNLIFAGVAGGLSPRLAAGDLLLARTIRGPFEALPDPELLGRAACGEAIPATLVTAPGICASAESKARLYATLPDGGPAAVDLESSAWAASAQGRLPYLVVRSISDTAEESLPGFLEDCLDAEGGISRWKVVRHAIVHPGSIAPLGQMRDRVRLCATKLASFVETLLAADWTTLGESHEHARANY